MSEVPIGKKCTDCGCCLATVKAGDDWLCWECDAGETCKAKRQAATPRPGPRPFKTSAAQIIQPPTPIKPKENPVTVISSRTSNARISDEIRNAIIAADPSVSHSELARSHGVSDVSVYHIRKQAGIKLVKGTHAAKPKKRAITPKLKSTLVKQTQIVKVPQPTPSVAKISISIDIDEEVAAGLWERFSLEDKAVAIRSVLMSQLEHA
jgi:transposase-like protein